MRSLVLAAAAALAFATTAGAVGAPHCTANQEHCRDTCIPKGHACANQWPQYPVYCDMQTSHPCGHACIPRRQKCMMGGH